MDWTHLGLVVKGLKNVLTALVPWVSVYHIIYKMNIKLSVWQLPTLWLIFETRTNVCHCTTFHCHQLLGGILWSSCRHFQTLSASYLLGFDQPWQLLAWVWARNSLRSWEWISSNILDGLCALSVTDMNWNLVFVWLRMVQISMILVTILIMRQYTLLLQGCQSQMDHIVYDEDWCTVLSSLTTCENLWSWSVASLTWPRTWLFDYLKERYQYFVLEQTDEKTIQFLISNNVVV